MMQWSSSIRDRGRFYCFSLGKCDVEGARDGTGHTTYNNGIALPSLSRPRGDDGLDEQRISLHGALPLCGPEGL
jgi:hypothetical protein